MSLLIFEKQLLIYIFVLLIGLKFPNETFGSCSIPSAVWQVDPFGHSREQESLFARMGFEFEYRLQRQVNPTCSQENGDDVESL